MLHAEYWRSRDGKCLDSYLTSWRPLKSPGLAMREGCDRRVFTSLPHAAAAALGAHASALLQHSRSTTPCGCLCARSHSPHSCSWVVVTAMGWQHS